jgi:hypothetical protein
MCSDSRSVGCRVHTCRISVVQCTCVATHLATWRQQISRIEKLLAFVALIAARIHIRTRWTHALHIAIGEESMSSRHHLLNLHLQIAITTIQLLDCFCRSQVGTVQFEKDVLCDSIKRSVCVVHNQQLQTDSV